MGSRHNMDDASPEKVLESLLRPRIIEEKMLVLLRQGRLGKWFSGMGQEAISVGAAMAMPKDEYLLPLHRNLGVFTTRGISLERLLHQFRGNINGFTKRSEEHTSELQSLMRISYAVFCLKTKNTIHHQI